MSEDTKSDYIVDTYFKPAMTGAKNFDKRVTTEIEVTEVQDPSQENQDAIELFGVWVNVKSVLSPKIVT